MSIFSKAQDSWAERADEGWVGRETRTFTAAQFQEAITPLAEQMFKAGVEFGRGMAKGEAQREGSGAESSDTRKTSGKAGTAEVQRFFAPPE